MEFNNEIIDGQSTVAENLAKSNRNFMLLKELLKNGVSQTEMEAYLKVADLVDKVVEIKVNNAINADQAGNSAKLDNLGSRDFVKQLLWYDNQTTNQLNIEIVNNPSYPSAYIGDISFGTQIGFNQQHIKLIYIPHKSSLGYGTQIGIPFESGQFSSMYIRNSIGTTWSEWNDMRSLGYANSNSYRNTRDANTALEGKLYYAEYNVCQNLPRGTSDDGVILPIMHRNDNHGKWGMQFYYTWNNQELWYRIIQHQTFHPWKCIGGGKWDFHPDNDNTTIMKYLRWENYGQNHIIFDASRGITPSGRACDKINSEIGWTATYPTLMGWNGANTYGVRVANAGWADGAANIQGFQFRNNNGWLEVLEHGTWRRVTT